MNVNTTDDYFAVRGCRKMVLRMLLQTMTDLTLKPTNAENIKHIRDAREWVEYQPATNMLGSNGQRQIGLTFADCFYTLGEASSASRYREAVLADPLRVRDLISSALDSINAEEAVYLDNRESHKAEQISVGGYNTSWLFQVPSEHQLMRGGANG
jgi:hypothetical protein